MKQWTRIRRKGMSWTRWMGRFQSKWYGMYRMKVQTTPVNAPTKRLNVKWSVDDHIAYDLRK